MKKYIVLSMLCLPVLFSCMDNELNKDPYGADKELMERLPKGGNQLLSLQKLVLPEQENSYQMCFDLFATNYAGYAATTKFFDDYPVYNPRTGWIGYPFDDTYPKIYNGFRPLYANSNGDFNEVYFAWGSILRVAITHWLTDTYGPLPYSAYTKEVSANEDQSVKPYDSQEELYLGMCSDLKNAVEGLKKADLSDRSYKSFDLVYEGDFAKWIKYANSLLLRLAIRMSKVDPQKAREYAEFAVGNGVILENTENAALKTTDNPVNKTANLWGDSRINAEITEYMKTFSDPRQEKYFTEVAMRTGNDIYAGLRSGINSVNSMSIDVKNYATPNVSANSPIYWITASEVAFLKAEGALNGWQMNETAEELYTKGIELSFEQWGVSSASYMQNSNKRSGYTDVLAPIFNQPDFESDITVRWSDAQGDEEKQLARIITQKWIAMFPYGSHEAWAEWRRTGYPHFMPAQINNSANAVQDIRRVNGKDTGGMRRLPYSQNETINNGPNLLKAIQYLGGADTGGTDLWWVD